MTYESSETPGGVQVSVEATDREALFREALAAVLALVSPASPPDPLYDASIPLQAAGRDDRALLAGLVEGALRAASEGRGRLGPPRWLLFEAGRATANLALAAGSSTARPLTLRSVDVDPGGTKASLVLANGVAH